MSENWGRGWRGDMLVALAAILVCILVGLVGQPDWWWSAMMAATLALRRTAPVAMATVAMCISLAHVLAEASFLLPGDAILLVAAYSMAAHSRKRHSIIGSILGLTFLTVFTGRAIAGGQVPAHSSAVLIIGLVSVSFVAAWSLGLLLRHRADAVQQAEYRRLLSERDAEARSQLAALEEREHISDEIHDVLAHTLTGIVIQAESGQAIAPTSEVYDLFARISGAGRSALTEVRCLLAPADSEKTSPSPSLEDLDRLLQELRSSGLRISYQEDGGPVPLSPGLSLAVYWVLQESLTNVIRHGAESSVQLVFSWTAESLTVTVSNPIEAESVNAPVREHRGIAGMRRRCTLYGGRLSYEVYDSFTLVAIWPLTAAGTTVTAR